MATFIDKTGKSFLGSGNPSQSKIGKDAFKFAKDLRDYADRAGGFKGKLTGAFDNYSSMLSAEGSLSNSVKAIERSYKFSPQAEGASGPIRQSLSSFFHPFQKARKMVSEGGKEFEGIDPMTMIRLREQGGDIIKRYAAKKGVGVATDRASVMNWTEKTSEVLRKTKLQLKKLSKTATKEELRSIKKKLVQVDDYKESLDHLSRFFAKDLPAAMGIHVLREFFNMNDNEVRSVDVDQLPAEELPDVIEGKIKEFERLRDKTNNSTLKKQIQSKIDSLKEDIR